jgi:hypothetical protein
LVTITLGHFELIFNVIIIIAIYKPLLSVTRLTANVIKTNKATHMRRGEFSLNTKDENPKPHCEKQNTQHKKLKINKI